MPRVDLTTGRFVPTPPEERFWRLVEKTDACWLWRGETVKGGYGRHSVSFGGGRHIRKPAHRYAYELLRGEIPSGLQLDHLCRVTSCVNPDHLEPVTARENNLRGNSPGAQNARRTHCIRGHELGGTNLYVTPDGRRQCRCCRAMASKKVA